MFSINNRRQLFKKMKRLLMFVALFATLASVTFTSCKKDSTNVDKKISGSYLCLNDYDFFEVLDFSDDGSLSSRGFYGNKSGEEVGYWSDVKGNYKINGDKIDLIFEDGDNSYGTYHLNDVEFVFIDNETGSTTIYKKLTATDNKNILGNWKSFNMCMMSDPKVEFIEFPEGVYEEPFPVANLDGSVVRDIVEHLFSDITFAENGQFTFKYGYEQQESGTYVNNNRSLVLTINVNGAPISINCSLAQNVNRNESFIFLGKESCLKLSMVYIYQKLIESGQQFPEEGFAEFYQLIGDAFNDFAVAVSLNKH